MIQNQTTTTKAKGSKLKPLKICDRALLVLTLLILASSLQLEITAGATPLWVWLHMVLGTLFLLLILRHLYLHFRWTNWWTRLVASRPAPSAATAPSPKAPLSPSPDSRPAQAPAPKAPFSSSLDSRPAQAPSFFNVSVPVQWSERKRAASPQSALPRNSLRPPRNSRRPLRCLTITGLLLLLSAIVAALHWLAAPVHSFPGALHGKIGFLFLILLIPHILRHRRFYLPRKPARKHPADTRLPNPSPLRPLSPAPLSNRGEA